MNMTACAGFANRQDAGRQLGRKLSSMEVGRNPVLLALPRGGVPVAAEIAAVMGLRLDLLIVRKLGVPGHEEYAMGAIAGGGVMVLDHHVVARLGLDLDDVEKVLQRETAELERRELFYRKDRPVPEVSGRTVILVDDGVATGSTMSAAIKLLRHRKAGSIVVAVPVAPPETAKRLRQEADEVVTLIEPPQLIAVGRWYRDFSQTTDEEVIRLLDTRD